MPENLEIWDRLPDETARAYETFCAYRDMGPGRSALRVWRSGGGGDTASRVPGKIQDWSITHRWVERAEAYDNYMERMARSEREKAHREEIIQHGKRSRQIATATMRSALNILTKANAKLEGMDAADLPPYALGSIFRAAAAIADSALNAESHALAVDKLLNAIQDAPSGE